MNVLERSIIYATEKHAGVKRKGRKVPYILHPLEVAQIISTMTDDIEIMSAGILHDVVEDTDGTIEEIRQQFGDRVADLVATETENKYKGIPPEESWQKRKEESLYVLKNTNDMGVKILWLGDKLANIRSLSSGYSEKGEEIWQLFHQHDPDKHLWYYRSIAEALEIDLNRTGAYKEFIQHINFIWPGTFAIDKEKYKKYKEYSTEGCELIGKGAKGNVYRYNDEIILKVYNEQNTYKDIERETYLARSAFVAGIPTAISFGIVTVGDRYGSVFEFLECENISQLLSKDSTKVKHYAKVMASLAKWIHGTDGSDIDLPDGKDEVYDWISGGIAHEDEALTKRITKMVDDIPNVKTMIHGDFHTGNIMIQPNGEPLLIDMDSLAHCHPIVEFAGLYMFYVGFGELRPKMVEDFMGISYENSKMFFDELLNTYFEGDEEKITAVKEKAALLCYVRLMRRIYKRGLVLDEESEKARDYYMNKIHELIEKVDNLYF